MHTNYKKNPEDNRHVNKERCKPDKEVYKESDIYFAKLLITLLIFQPPHNERVLFALSSKPSHKSHDRRTVCPAADFSLSSPNDTGTALTGK
jgi:hypothetical protein